MATLNKISEQIQRIYSRQGKQENIKPTLDKREVYPLVEQAINTILRAKIFEGISYGYVEIPKCSMVLYANIPVVSDGERAYIDLPIAPLDLINDMGVWSLTLPANPFSGYIPIPVQGGSVMIGTLFENIEGQVGFYRVGTYRVYLTKNVTTAANGSVLAVDGYLLVHDLSKYDADDPLPVSPDYEELIIKHVLSQLGIVGYNQINIEDADKNNR